MQISTCLHINSTVKRLHKWKKHPMKQWLVLKTQVVFIYTSSITWKIQPWGYAICFLIRKWFLYTGRFNCIYYLNIYMFMQRKPNNLVEQKNRAWYVTGPFNKPSLHELCWSPGLCVVSWQPSLNTASIYNRTCLERPAHWPQKGVSQDRWSLITARFNYLAYYHIIICIMIKIFRMDFVTSFLM